MVQVESFERQVGESREAFAAFALYRDQLSLRSTRAVALALGKSPRLIARWSSRWAWTARSREYDVHIDRLARKKAEQEILAFRARAAAQIRGKIQTLMLADYEISSRLAVPGGLDLKKLTQTELIRLSITGGFSLPNLLKMEALLLGDATDRPANPLVDDDVLTKTIEGDDELLAISAGLIQRASVKLGGGAARFDQTRGLLVAAPNSAQ
jgi:hypothetical protein